MILRQLWDSLDQMLARRGYFISGNCPHTPGTSHLLSSRRCQLMPARKLCAVNTRARRRFIDENALLKECWKTGKLQGRLSVEHEPAITPKLLKLAQSNKGRASLPTYGICDHRGRMDYGRYGDCEYQSLLALAIACRTVYSPACLRGLQSAQCTIDNFSDLALVAGSDQRVAVWVNCSQPDWAVIHVPDKYSLWPCFLFRQFGKGP